MFAVSVELLDALRAAREYVDHMAEIDGPTDEDGVPLDDAAITLLELDTAIAKAEGRE